MDYTIWYRGRTHFYSPYNIRGITAIAQIIDKLDESSPLETCFWVYITNSLYGEEVYVFHRSMDKPEIVKKLIKQQPEDDFANKLLKEQFPAYYYFQEMYKMAHGHYYNEYVGALNFAVIPYKDEKDITAIYHYDSRKTLV